MEQLTKDAALAVCHDGRPRWRHQGWRRDVGRVGCGNIRTWDPGTYSQLEVTQLLLEVEQIGHLLPQVPRSILPTQRTKQEGQPWLFRNRSTWLTFWLGWGSQSATIQSRARLV